MSWSSPSSWSRPLSRSVCSAYSDWRVPSTKSYPLASRPSSSWLQPSSSREDAGCGAAWSGTRASELCKSSPVLASLTSASLTRARPEPTTPRRTSFSTSGRFSSPLVSQVPGSNTYTRAATVVDFLQSASTAGSGGSTLPVVCSSHSSSSSLGARHLPITCAT